MPAASALAKAMVHVLSIISVSLSYSDIHSLSVSCSNTTVVIIPKYRAVPRQIKELQGLSLQLLSIQKHNYHFKEKQIRAEEDIITSATAC